MNVLKKLKYLSIAALGLLFTLTVASCGKTSTITGGSSPTNSGITDDDSSFSTAAANVSESGFNFDTAYLSSTTINTKNARTTFYLGEEFSSEGVVVEANYMQTIDGKRVTETLTSTNFTTDSSKVDMYNIGTYPVEVTYRYKATVYTTTYSINVISSELADSGEEYVGGIEVSYSASNVTAKSKTEYNIDLGKTFDATVSPFTISQHIFVGEEEKTSKPIGTKNYSTDGSKSVKIDTSAVDTTKRGDYIVSVEYTPEALSYNDKEISYSVKAFIIVHVIDPITNVVFASGTQSFAATAGDFDFSDWTFTVTRKNSGASTVTYNANDFYVFEVVPFVSGNQAAKVNYMDYEATVTVNIVVTESVEYNITTGNIYKNTDEGCTGEVWTDNIDTSAVDVALDSTGLFKITKPNKYTLRPLKDTGFASDSYGKVYFGNRPTIKGKGSYISVTMENAGVLVVYAASTGTTQRDVCVYDAPDSGNEVGIGYVSDTKVKQFIFEIEAAGTYYIQSFEGGIYVHGAVIAVKK